MLDIDHICEAATDYYSPCCDGHGMYAHFAVHTDKSEKLIGFQCTNCGQDYDVSEKDEFES